MDQIGGGSRKASTLSDEKDKPSHASDEPGQHKGRGVNKSPEQVTRINLNLKATPNSVPLANRQAKTVDRSDLLDTAKEAIQSYAKKKRNS